MAPGRDGEQKDLILHNDPGPTTRQPLIVGRSGEMLSVPVIITPLIAATALLFS